MQAQYQPVAHHHDPFSLPSHSVYPLHSDQIVAPTGEVDFTQNFLGGSSSSYNVHEDSSRYNLYRGEVTYRLPSSVGDATGMGFAMHPPNTASSLFPAEEFPSFIDATWSWNQAQASAHGVVAPIPMLPSAPEASFLPIKSKEEPNLSSIERSPGPPLPTPAALAVLLQSRPRPVGQSSLYDSPPSDLGRGAHSAAIQAGVAVVPGQPEVATAETTSSREKKHACTMCHKR